MHEVFYVLSGRGVFLIDDVPHTVANGSFVHVRLWLPLLLLGSIGPWWWWWWWWCGVFVAGIDQRLLRPRAFMAAIAAVVVWLLWALMKDGRNVGG